MKVIFDKDREVIMVQVVGEGGGHDGKETCHDKGFSEGNNLSSLELGRFALSRKFRHFF